MLLSTAIPMIIAAMVMVIISKGIPNNPIIPKIKKAAIKFGITPIKDNFRFLNKISKTNIPAIDFRRNIITENIKLNDLVDKEFFVGNVKLKAHDLCRPCKYLQDKLYQNNFIKEFLHKGGLRCEILTSGKINVGDIIK